MKSAFIGITWIKMGEEELGRRVIRGAGLNHDCTIRLALYRNLMYDYIRARAFSSWRHVLSTKTPKLVC